MSGPSATVFSTVRKGKMHCFTCSVTVLFIPSLSLTHTHNPATHTLALTCTCMINQTPSKYTKKLRKQKHILKAKQSNNKTPQHYHILTSNEKVKNTHHSKTKWTISIKVRVSTKETECVCVCVCVLYNDMISTPKVQYCGLDSPTFLTCPSSKLRETTIK